MSFPWTEHFTVAEATLMEAYRKVIADHEFRELAAYRKLIPTRTVSEIIGYLQRNPRRKEEVA